MYKNTEHSAVFLEFTGGLVRETSPAQNTEAVGLGLAGCCQGTQPAAGRKPSGLIAFKSRSDSGFWGLTWCCPISLQNDGGPQGLVLVLHMHTCTRNRQQARTHKVTRIDSPLVCHVVGAGGVLSRGKLQ